MLRISAETVYFRPTTLRNKLHAMNPIPTWVTNGLLILAAIYTFVQILRLFLPVYFWSFDRNAAHGRAILAVCDKDTSPSQIARAVPAESCLARIMRAQDLNEAELACKADFRRRGVYCFVAFGLTLIAQFKPDAPAILMPLSQALLLCAIGMVIGVVARFRILRTMDVAETTLKAKGLLTESLEKSES